MSGPDFASKEFRMAVLVDSSGYYRCWSDLLRLTSSLHCEDSCIRSKGWVQLTGRVLFGLLTWDLIQDQITADGFDSRFQFTDDQSDSRNPNWKFHKLNWVEPGFDWNRWPTGLRPRPVIITCYMRSRASTHPQRILTRLIRPGPNTRRVTCFQSSWSDRLMIGQEKLIEWFQSRVRPVRLIKTTDQDLDPSWPLATSLLVTYVSTRDLNFTLPSPLVAHLRPHPWSRTTSDGFLVPLLSWLDHFSWIHVSDWMAWIYFLMIKIVDEHFLFCLLKCGNFGSITVQEPFKLEGPKTIAGAKGTVTERSFIS